MGIELRGTFAGNTGFSITILISLALSIFLFFVLSFVDAKDWLFVKLVELTQYF